MTTESHVTVTHEGSVAVLTMHYRPHNLIGPRLMGPLLAGLAAARAAGARAVLIRSGLRNFSAGADLDMFESRMPPQEKPFEMSPAEFLGHLTAYPLPLVASIHGACLGGGFELALACDFIIAAKSAKIGSVEVTLGLIPLMGAVQRQVQNAGLLRAKEMAMLGHRHDAATLERWNLINRVVPDELLDAAALAIAQELAHGPTLAHGLTKQLARIAADQGVAAADAAMEAVTEPLWRSEDLAIGVASLKSFGPGMAKFVGR